MLVYENITYGAENDGFLRDVSYLDPFGRASPERLKFRGFPGHSAATAARPRTARDRRSADGDGLRADCWSKMRVGLRSTARCPTIGLMPAALDLDLHGFVRIRLLNAEPRDVATVIKQVGPIRADTSGEPDIVIEFVDRLRFSSPLRYLGVNDAAFTDDAFLVLRGKQKSRVRVQVPLQDIGRRCRFVCERGLPAVPLLMAVVNLTALGNGVLPLHASGLIYNGSGVLVTGWAKGGKTETLLAFAANGAEYVGDEWIYLADDGTRMYGVPEPIRIWSWHLEELPQYRALVRSRDRIRLRGLSWITRTLGLLDSGSRSHALARRLRAILDQQLYVHLRPEQLFDGACVPVGTPEKIFFVASHESPEMTVEPMPAREIAEKMVFSLQMERAEFMSYYYAFRFAFPGLSNDLVERAEQIQREKLIRALDKREAFAVYHPYPCSVPALFEVMKPHCG